MSYLIFFCEDRKVRQKQEEEHGIKMTKNDFSFLNSMRTDRKAESTLDDPWCRTQKAKQDGQEKKRKRENFEFDFVPPPEQPDTEWNVTEENVLEDSDEDFPTTANSANPRKGYQRETRSTADTDPLPPEFRNIRDGNRSVKDSIWEAITKLDGFGFIYRNIEIAITVVANTCFGRNWKMSTEISNEDLKNTLPKKTSMAEMLKNIQVGSMQLVAKRLCEAKEEGHVISYATDSTTRKSVGKFAPCGLHISKEEYLPLLTLPVGSEVRENNAEAVVTSFDLLAVGSSATKEELYQNVDVHLTDSTAHNKSVTKIVADKMHREEAAGAIFCTTHTTLGMDNGMTKVVKKLEEDMDLPRICQNFMVEFSVDSKKETVLTTAIAWTMSLFGPEKSHKPWSCFARFKEFLKKRNQRMCVLPMKDFRFGCLSMCAAILLFHFDDFTEFLSDCTDVTNKLACLVRDALNLPYLQPVLVVLAAFGIQMISPFHAKSIETSTTHSSFQLFCSKLYEDLKTRNIDALFFDFSLPFYEISTELLRSVVSRYNKNSEITEAVQAVFEQFPDECIKLANSMRHELAETLMRQRGQAYDFSENPSDESVFRQLPHTEDIDKTPINNLKMERECGNIDYRLKVKQGHLENVARGNFLHQTAYLRDKYGAHVFRNVRDAVKEFDGILTKWKSHQAELQEVASSRKDEQNLHIENRKLEILQFLKSKGGPFTNTSEIDAYLKDSSIPQKEKQKRMKKEVMYARDSCVSLPHTNSVFKMLQVNSDGKRKMLSAEEFGKNLKTLFGKANSKQSVTFQDFHDALSKLPG